MVKYIIAGLVIGMLILSAEAKEKTSIVGKWHPVGVSEINLFAGDITVTQIKKRTDGFYTLIYDTDKHALVCFYASEGNHYVCMPSLLNKDKITPQDKIDEILAGASEDGTMFVRSNLNGNKLTLSIAPFGSDCINPETCVFKKLPVYQRK